MVNGGNAGISIGALVAVAVALYVVLVVRRRK
ncbi:MYXO-CTERM sorting domain-containing protein [Sinomonas soli]